MPTAIILNTSFSLLKRKVPNQLLHSFLSYNDFITKGNFRFFESGALWVIPEGITLIITVPEDVELKPPVPEAVVTGKTITWKGFKSSNSLEIRYTEFKQIAPSFELSQFFQMLLGSEEGIIILGITVVCIVALYWKRESISDKIENYIVEHSDLGSKIEEEED
mgnify:CR=1 FL=1